MPRFYCPLPLSVGAALSLPSGATRHVQVLRLQPGSEITLFNGEGGEFSATVTLMGRSEVQVLIGAHSNVEREAPCAVHLLLGTPANERMDWLVEKATELGVASITPLLTQRSVLRLSGERAEKKQAHWQAIAIAAAEQCGRNRVPELHALQSFTQWQRSSAASAVGQRLLLSLGVESQNLAQTVPSAASLVFLSGPEGGLTQEEESTAMACGFIAVTLGPRVLRAETAPLAALAAINALAGTTA
jgi:16S rRNA (uracil1498-N3)-methyltransferase